MKAKEIKKVSTKKNVTKKAPVEKVDTKISKKSMDKINRVMVDRKEYLRTLMVPAICKEFKFEMAHKLIDSYTPQCKNIHGHSYKVVIRLGSKRRDNFGFDKDFMVTDFKRLKEILQPLIDELDHSFLVCKDDPIMTRSFKETLIKENQKVNVSNFNPTAEGLAIYFTQYLASKKLSKDVEVEAVSVFETATSEATIFFVATKEIEEIKKLEIKRLASGINYELRGKGRK
ncbi:6-carboxytetrahydropterin synthase [Campylobacter upsaliensis]|uniref:6-pyruvoyl trahydropterin synthase family protein n=1 Tax=Campylobacter upsaliensis TaxID=28080 RepID=UPI0012CBF447|nr:6-carboxytetrahydropterin synthase [Campylobacter upsaliensis]EAK7296978.1 6-carboxytetrahydropterin synthase [Campylobacter upsaliensis]MBJ6809611.1 6-carboxytetrahydropterin synthase [Campylobacter upsaliensis]